MNEFITFMFQMILAKGLMAHVRVCHPACAIKSIASKNAIVHFFRTLPQVLLPSSKRINKKGPTWKTGGAFFVYMAEREGFEPSEGFPSPVFKTGTFGQLCHLSVSNCRQFSLRSANQLITADFRRTQ